MIGIIRFFKKRGAGDSMSSAASSAGASTLDQTCVYQMGKVSQKDKHHDIPEQKLLVAASQSETKPKDQFNDNKKVRIKPKGQSETKPKGQSETKPKVRIKANPAQGNHIQNNKHAGQSEDKQQSEDKHTETMQDECDSGSMLPPEWELGRAPSISAAEAALIFFGR